jgi:hypothetical protein
MSAAQSVNMKKEDAEALKREEELSKDQKEKGRNESDLSVFTVL